MTIKKISSEGVTDYNINNNFNEILTINGLNIIRALQNASISFSANKDDFWGDAYIDEGGRENTVNLVSGTTAEFDTNKYDSTALTDEATTDTTSDPDSFTNASNAFDTDNSTYASESINDTSVHALGKTFAAKTVKRIKAKVYLVAPTGFTTIAKFQTYNGSTWSDVASGQIGTVNDDAESAFTKIMDLDASVQGVRVAFLMGTADTRIQKLYYLRYGDEVDGEIKHTIPSGTFSTTISSAIGIPLVVDWETGADIKYKLINAAGNDSGWLECGVTPKVNKFTIFTAEPDSLIIKLLTKTTSPTTGYPSIKGFVIRTT